MTAELLSELDNRVLRLTLSNPGKRNSLEPAIYASGRAALDAAADDASIGAIVLTGAGDTFSAGGNLERLIANRARPPRAQRESVEALHGFVRALRRCPKPVIAAVEGAAAGAGFSLALACDLIVAAETAVFVMAYARVGLTPDGGATLWLARSFPPQLAAEILLESGRLSAERLHQLGVVNRLVAPGSALTHAMGWASRLAAGPTTALGRAKALLQTAYTDDPTAHLEREAGALTDAVHGDEAGEGIAAFLAKREPRWPR